jgi:polyhydroxyalkanoate synthesis regulator phasin
MSTEESQKILQMVEDGKINAEEALILIRALDEDESQEDSSDEGAW